ncbi:hypothetical protein BC828DRAFT_385268 [Blastocladiella britannica]|nr:hypothetical protein BC828DRAFT_385268 [Blastocladiella britannica]
MLRHSLFRSNPDPKPHMAAAPILSCPLPAPTAEIAQVADPTKPKDKDPPCKTCALTPCNCWTAEDDTLVTQTLGSLEWTSLALYQHISQFPHVLHGMGTSISVEMESGCKPSAPQRSEAMSRAAKIMLDDAVGLFGTGGKRKRRGNHPNQCGIGKLGPLLAAELGFPSAPEDATSEVSFGATADLPIASVAPSRRSRRPIRDDSAATSSLPNATAARDSDRSARGASEPPIGSPSMITLSTPLISGATSSVSAGVRRPRHPPLDPDLLVALRAIFEQCRYPGPRQRDEIAAHFGINVDRVTRWFEKSRFALRIELKRENKTSDLEDLIAESRAYRLAQNAMERAEKLTAAGMPLPGMVATVASTYPHETAARIPTEEAAPAPQQPGSRHTPPAKRPKLLMCPPVSASAGTLRVIRRSKSVGADPGTNSETEANEDDDNNQEEDGDDDDEEDDDDHQVHLSLDQFGGL